MNKSEFTTVDDLTKNNLVDCFQIQINDNTATPVYLGKYPDVPLPVNKIINFKDHNLHVVTYILTKEEIENKLFKIVGVNVFKKNEKNSLCSLDLVYENETFRLVFSDHLNNTSSIIQNIETIPPNDEILVYVIEQVFSSPIKELITN